MRKEVFISTAIPYVNARPHIGFALELVQADAAARWHRGRGDDVFFLTGTDENSLKNVQAAEREGVAVRVLVDKNAEVFRELTKKLNISNDDFIRTSVEERHIKGAQKLWASCQPSDIYKKKYRGLYCVGCEEFKTEKELIDGRCSEHPGERLQAVEEENYFFRLSVYQDKLLKLIESREIEIVPEGRRNEMLAFIKTGLQDFSISRSRARAREWGVVVPGDESQIMYVWFDALANYITALDYAEDGDRFKKYWEEGKEIIHVIGKGINRFHSIYWPAMLLSAGVRPPRTIFAHGYVTVEEQKISKSLGNVIDPFVLVDKYGLEAVRYYLLREIPSHQDGDFSYEKFEARYNGDLANGLGNFAARVLKLVSQEKVAVPSLAKDDRVREAIEAAEALAAEKAEKFAFSEVLAGIWELISFGDRYVNEKRPWESREPAVIGDLSLVVKKTQELVEPYLPRAAEKIRKHLEEGVALTEPLWPRLELERK